MSTSHEAPDWREYKMDYRRPHRELEPVEQEEAKARGTANAMLARAEAEAKVTLPPGCLVSWGGQFELQQQRRQLPRRHPRLRCQGVDMLGVGLKLG